VDGVTIRTDFVSAMAQSLLDIPVLLQSTRADLILFPRRDVVSMDANLFELFLSNNFRSWPKSSLGDDLSLAYRNSTEKSVLRAFGELITDITMYCAHLELATRALLPRTRRSPIYVSVVDQPPSNPVKFAVPDTCPPELKGDAQCSSIPFSFKEPCHVWDYMTAARAWKQLSTLGLSQTYVPSALDEKLGDLLKTQWTNFVLSKGISFNQSAFDSRVDFPTDFAVNVQGDTNFSATTRVVQNYRAPFCRLLKDSQLNPDSRFWLVN
jgi:hypothetical protein